MTTKHKHTSKQPKKGTIAAVKPLYASRLDPRYLSRGWGLIIAVTLLGILIIFLSSYVNEKRHFNWATTHIAYAQAHFNEVIKLHYTSKWNNNCYHSTEQPFANNLRCVVEVDGSFQTDDYVKAGAAISGLAKLATDPNVFGPPTPNSNVEYNITDQDLQCDFTTDSQLTGQATDTDLLKRAENTITFQYACSGPASHQYYPTT